MHRPLYLLGLGYLAICGAVVLRHRAPPSPDPQAGMPPVRLDGSGNGWFAAIKSHCNVVEVELAQRTLPAPPTLEGQGFSAACYALGGKIEREVAALLT